MLDLNDRIAALSPEKRALLQQQLAKTEADNAARRKILHRGLSTAPLSFPQQRLWFIDQLDPGKSTYNLPSPLKLFGELDEEALRRSLSEIVRRHEVLRTTFELVDGEPVQRIHPAAEVPLPIADLQSLDLEARASETRRRIAEEGQKPFDLEKGPVFRAGLLKLAPEEHILLLTVHHIASDAWSRGIFVRELRTLYDAFHQGKPSPLPELPIQYADYAAWQREWLQGEVLDGQIQYWKECLVGAPALLELPTDRPRPAMRTFQGAIKHAILPLSLLESLKQMSQAEGTTLFMTLLAAFNVLLWRYSGQNDIVVGTPTAGRTREEAEPLIGFFVNTLALRGDLSGDPTFKELLGRIREVALGAFAHQDLPFERLVEELQPERSLSHSPVFQVMFQLDNAPRSAANLEGLRITNASDEVKTAKLDLQLSAAEMPDKLGLVVEYSTDLFDADRIERLLGHFETLLEGIVTNPGERISLLPLLTQPELDQLLVDWNTTQSDHPRDRGLHALVEEQAARTPNAPAVVFQDRTLTYVELNACANRVAHLLKKQGVGPETLVGLCVNRSLDLVVGVLGILKAGGAYVPMDPAYPPDRVAYMLSESKASLLLTQTSLLDQLPKTSARSICMDDAGLFSQESSDNPTTSVSPSNLAYVIYTSGSTGRPKGVALTHGSAAALIYWAQGVYSAEELSGVLGSTSICFDLSVFELFLPLSAGGSVIVAQNALELPTLPSRERVTLVNTVPSAIAELYRMGGIPASVRTINLAGEPLTSELADKLYETGVKKVYDLYGPSEDTTYSTWSLRKAGGPATIGRPIANTRAYLLDKRMCPVPLGVAGELYLGGEGLARGYYGRPDATAEKFVPDPFSGEPGARLYRTGDLARYFPNGDIEFLGRIDHQVKVRGFRIELGEIESVLKAHPGVKETVVVAREDVHGEKSLVGYVVGAGEEEPTANDLRDHLREKLPEYMFPSAFVFLNGLPLSPNGKVDRKALPKPDGNEYRASAEFVAPRNSAEEALAKIFTSLLDRDHIGIYDNFFELGGHSMMAIRLLTEIGKVFGRKLPIRILFQSATIASLIQEIAGDQETKCWTILDTVVPQQVGSERIPLCCVAAPDVNSLGYVALGRHMGPDQPLFILHSRYRNNRDRPYTRKEFSDMAAANIAAMRAALPNGPYCLGGMCDGAHIAFEMARQLRQAGEEVPLLISFDAWPEENTRTRFGLWTWYLRMFGKHRKMSLKEKLVQMVGITWVAGSEWALIPMRKPGPHRWASRYWPGRDFKPDRFDGKITVLRVEKQESFRIKRRDLGWGDWTTSTVDVYDVPGNHSTILRNENVAQVAVLVRRDIDRISQNEKSAEPIAQNVREEVKV